MSSHTTSEIRLVADDLWKYYGSRAVVQGVSFSLEPGEILGLLGRNGAGKTTIVSMLYGSVIRSKGSAKLQPIDIASDSSQARSRLGVVTQEDNLDPDFNVRDNLILFAHHYRITGEKAAKRADELIEMLRLEDYRKHAIPQLSGGLQRRLVLARALIPDPQIIFLDEPTTGFDPDVRQEFWKFIIELRQRGKSILLTTHYMDEAERLCNRLLLLQDGKKIDEGTPTELVQRIIGEEVVEITGMNEEALHQVIEGQEITVLPFGTAFLIPKREFTPTIQNSFESIPSCALSIRSANLEDVFLALSGKPLHSRVQ